MTMTRAEDVASPHAPRLTAYEAGRWYAIHDRALPGGATADCRRGYWAVRENGAAIMTMQTPYIVTGDYSRLVYSRHATEAAALRAARRLARRWGWSHPGAEPQVVCDGRVLHVLDQRS